MCAFSSSRAAFSRMTSTSLMMTCESASVAVCLGARFLELALHARCRDSTTTTTFLQPQGDCECLAVDRLPLQTPLCLRVCAQLRLDGSLGLREQRLR